MLILSLVSLCLGIFPIQAIAQRDIPIRKDTTPPSFKKNQPVYSEEKTGRQMIDYPSVKLRSLDKTTARTVTFEAQVGSTLKFGPIFIKIQACRKASALDEPESAAFLQIWEVTPEQEAVWIFSGWMFASSPGLSAMDHPIYDVWVIDCLDNISEENTAQRDDSTPEQDEGVIQDNAVPAKPEDNL